MLALGPNTPVYPGDAAVEARQVSNIDDAGYASYALELENHNSTHIDAPSHMIVGGGTLDAYPPEQFVDRGHLIDLRAVDSAVPFDLSAIGAGDIVLLWTGSATPSLLSTIICECHRFRSDSSRS
ncbi:MAG: cyclase family protein [Pseudonocardia sp.]|nr:cyclase family protein [Pseudonocardia sp.]